MTKHTKQSVAAVLVSKQIAFNADDLKAAVRYLNGEQTSAEFDALSAWEQMVVEEVTKAQPVAHVRAEPAGTNLRAVAVQYAEQELDWRVAKVRGVVYGCTANPRLGTDREAMVLLVVAHPRRRAMRLALVLQMHPMTDLWEVTDETDAEDYFRNGGKEEGAVDDTYTRRCVRCEGKGYALSMACHECNGTGRIVCRKAAAVNKVDEVNAAIERALATAQKHGLTKPTDVATTIKVALADAGYAITRKARR